jgi:predicted PurR-regulated permease PerM
MEWTWGHAIAVIIILILVLVYFYMTLSKVTLTLVVSDVEHSNKPHLDRWNQLEALLDQQNKPIRLTVTKLSAGSNLEEFKQKMTDTMTNLATKFGDSPAALMQIMMSTGAIIYRQMPYNGPYAVYRGEYTVDGLYRFGVSALPA